MTNVQPDITRDWFLSTLVANLSMASERILGAEAASANVVAIGLSMGTVVEESWHGGPRDRADLTLDGYVETILNLKNRIGGRFSLKEQREDYVLVEANRCPFGTLACESPALCKMTSSVFGGIGARNFGYAKVNLRKRIAMGDPTCLIGISLTECGRHAEEPGDVYYASTAHVSKDFSKELETMVELQRVRRRLGESEMRLENLVRDQGRTIHELHALQTITDKALTTLDLDELLQGLVDRVAETLAVDSAAILLLDPCGETIEVQASHGLPISRSPRFKTGIGEGFATQVIRERRPVIVSDVPASQLFGSHHVLRTAEVRSVLGVPLCAGDRVMGVVHAGSREPHDFVEREVRLLEVVAERAAMAIENVRLHDATRRQRSMLAEMLGRIVEAQEVERKRIALELHDGPAQSLASLLYRLETTAGLLKADPLRAAAELEKARGLLQDDVRQIRRMAFEIRPLTLDYLGLVPTVNRHVDEFSSETGISAEVLVEGVVPRLPIEVEVAAYRILQEALTNVRKHASASRVSVVVRYEEDALHLNVTDDGVGCEACASPAGAYEGLGLLGMHERARHLGGSLRVGRVEDGSGVSLTAILPALGPRDDAVVQCWDVAGCSETTRQECLPRLWDRRCFELDTCHCRGDGTSCMTCPVFAAAGGLHLGPAAEAPRV